MEWHYKDGDSSGGVDDERRVRHASLFIFLSGLAGILRVGVFGSALNVTELA
ncbi:MAG: hypothetical protein ACR2PL_28410 [Dehalococcoidia bacterium]